jgi:hypothetical protein
VLQRRLGRKRVSPELARQVPVAYFVFDVLYAGGELLIDRALRERTQILERLLAERLPIELEFESPQRSLPWPGQPGRLRVPVARTPSFGASSASELDRLFDQAQARGNEGLMIKDPASLYSPGRRGKAWLKLKRELAKLDVVVTAVEYGHGKRIGVLSDYTFAVRDGDELLNLGKAYSGLTDLEIARLTRWFLDHTVEAQGLRLLVEAKVVVEVAFNNITRSTRHNSGYALRFPRIVRLRPDKLPEEADTIDQVREIYRRQTTGGPGPEGNPVGLRLSCWRPGPENFGSVAVIVMMFALVDRNDASVSHLANRVFELNRGVMDVKLVMQAILDLAQNLIALRRRDVRDRDVARQGMGLRADAPDVQIMDIIYAAHGAHGAFDQLELQTSRGAFEQDVQGLAHDAEARP